ncbi:unnamed protein product [Peniophora sp. CBMAI 1063]|nr:unnamed protein product [Peniophora sp. CBMAI 1063]
MARDRLAAMRAQRQGGAPGSPPPAGFEMAALQEPNRIAPSNGYENGGGNGYGQAVSADPNAAFFNEVSSIQDQLRALDQHVARISDLHARTLNTADEAAGRQNEALLDESVAEARGLTQRIKTAIWEIEKQPTPPGQNAMIRKNQTKLLREKFVEALQNYQRVEQDYRQRYKQRVERQFKIVKPDATPEEVRAVVENDGGGQVFQQALMNTTRYDQSRMAYREVQERHEEIQKIERTLAELAQIFNDMSILVNQQDETINAIETSAQQVEGDTEAGLQQTEKAVVHARAARRKRWICFGIFVFIVLVLALVLGIYFGTGANKK